VCFGPASGEGAACPLDLAVFPHSRLVEDGEQDDPPTWCDPVRDPDCLPV
jgi:hypothetical protein